jgi:hypothetical protein
MSKCEASCLTIRVISPYGNEVSVGPVYPIVRSRLLRVNF